MKYGGQYTFEASTLLLPAVTLLLLAGTTTLSLLACILLLLHEKPGTSSLAIHKTHQACQRKYSPPWSPSCGLVIGYFISIVGDTTNRS